MLGVSGFCSVWSKLEDCSLFELKLQLLVLRFRKSGLYKLISCVIIRMWDGAAHGLFQIVRLTGNFIRCSRWS